MNDTYDIAVIGAGIAGASLAAELGPHARVIMLEAEDAPGRHATGRSAAFWAETYGGPLVQPLTTASGQWLEERGFLSDRGSLNIAKAGQEPELEAFIADFEQAGVRVERLGREEIEQIVPGLKPDWIYGVDEPDCRDIDVAGVHGWYLAEARKAGVELRCRAGLTEAGYDRDRGWTLRTSDGATIHCKVLANAAGAWADPVAQIAGIHPLGIQPLRRTVVQLRTAPAAQDDLPLVVDLGGSFYFKPESGRLWLSPHDETPSVPCDAAPEELDVAIAIDRFEQVVDWTVERVEHKWAGLRSFAPDRLPVYGFDPANPAFFWFAGQGGFGIQTAPAAARLAAQILLNLPADDLTVSLDRERYLASRFA
ncbi:FAD-dependent oxidoreductase [Erythrobacter sp. SG61-1L]|uniref:NAD(P)/FAD-dependent oxidoreductase n=1 Tax=Erythrobacter sp. SG61-1L TaxID=1603897 RepID=UPI0006C8FBB9|nr:FAD-dependent oxidoreductase [Erythrobacter sp. SG61-1L]KPL69651.1 FAD-dependent oxidoreductase [Erythrobacter sp. SG61-1L]